MEQYQMNKITYIACLSLILKISSSDRGFELFK